MWLNPQFPADLVTFTEEILNRKVHFLYSAWYNVAGEVKVKHTFDSKLIYKKLMRIDLLHHYLN